MITLKINEYCNNCPEFKADVEKTNFILSDFLSNNQLICDTVIKCKHQDRCKSMVDFITTHQQERK